MTPPRAASSTSGSHDFVTTILQHHKTRLTGLTDAEVVIRRDSYGPNVLTQKKKKSLWIQFLSQFKDLMVLILIGAAIISYIAHEANDAIVILVVVMINATIGFVQEYKTDKALESLKKLLAPRAIVRRNGAEQEIEASELVPGDIIIVQEGQCIPADGRVIVTHNIEVAEAALTGESVPVAKHLVSATENKDSKNAPDTMLFMGTEMVHGSGVAVVSGTGMQTEFGKIASMTTETHKDVSPLQKELFQIGLFVGKLTLGISLILIFASWLLQGRGLLESIIFAVAVAVAAVPEGLPATITIALTLAAQKLVRHHAIVKQLSSVETLGCTTVICSDKTGTLTKNEMTVQEVYVDNQVMQVSGVGYEPVGELSVTSGSKSLADLHDSLTLLARIGLLCNNAKLTTSHTGTYQILGDPTEGALLVLAKKYGLDVSKEMSAYPEIYELPFDSERKRMSTIHKIDNTKRVIYVKGAPDSLLDRCTHILLNGKEEVLTQTQATLLRNQNLAMAKRALRVLGFAYRITAPSTELDPDTRTEIYRESESESKLVFVGLMGMIDPPRPEVAEAVRLTRMAGIRIYIVTGDYGITAAAIAQQVGIVDGHAAKIITGDELDAMNESALLKILTDHKAALHRTEQIIFARVSPKHKMQIVSALKKLEDVVAVTGDGVNDAPALKRADIGVAMGISGTDVSKEAANMILTDDSFATIVTAVREGRRIYNNLTKFVYFIFSSNIGELVAIFTGVMLGLPLPLTAILILYINLGTDILPALALGIDPPSPTIMNVPPRSPHKRIMDRAFIARIFEIGFVIGACTIGAFVWTLYQHGWQWGQNIADGDPLHVKASTVAFAVMVLIEMCNVYNARSARESVFSRATLKNTYLHLSVALSIMLVLLVSYMPWFNRILHTAPLSLEDWYVILCAMAVVILFEEIRKAIVRSTATSRRIV